MRGGQSKVRKRPSQGAESNPTRDGRSVFRREGEYWTIAHRGTILRLRDSKGLRYVAYLLTHPGDRVAAHDLLKEGGQPRSKPRGLILGQPPTAPRPSPELPAVSGESARLAVTKRIRSALQRIQEHHPALGYHLTLSVKTGAHCGYLPDPERPIEWTT